MTTLTQPKVKNELKPNKNQTSDGSAASKAIRYAILIFFLAVVLIPVYVLFVTSFKGAAEADPTRTWYLPEVWNFDNWQRAWDALAAPIGRTFLLVIPSSIISAILGSMNGYVLSRWRFPGANVVFTFILFGMFIPYQAVMIPLMKIVLTMGLPNGIPTLILAHVVYGIPITTLIFRNYYESVPQELIEAARVDGAGMLRTYGPHLAVHLRVERLPIRPVPNQHRNRPRHPVAKQPGARVDHGRLRRLHGRRAHRIRANPDRVHPAWQVLRRRPHVRLRQGVARVLAY